MAKREDWKNRWGTWCRPTSMPGVYAVRDGGFVVRRRATSLATGKEVEIRRVLPHATLAQAIEWLEAETVRVRDGAHASAGSPKPRFSEYAASVMARKVGAGDLKSPASRSKWRYALEHLIAGTKNEDDEILVAGFGDYFIDAIKVGHVEEWRAECGRLVAKKLYRPQTINENWMPVLRGVSRAAAREFGIKDFTEGMKRLPEDEHPTFTEEDPNALTEEEIGAFLGELKVAYPQHYAFALVGFVTGLRPSTLRPLRRTGVDRDVLWDEGLLLIRRSQTLGDPINKPKTGLRQRMPLPPAVMEVLRWHVESQLVTPEQIDSDLLFPSIVGGYRSNTFLMKPFADVIERIGVGRKLTAKGMRRTFNDLSRAAGLRDVVIRAISGHQTESMQRRYSSVLADERRAGIAQVVTLASRRTSPKAAATRAKDATEPVAGRRRAP